MQILHISAECYPAAKAGGLGDVVGSLPKYLNQEGVPTAVVIPGYWTKWNVKQRSRIVYEDHLRLGQQHLPYSVHEVLNDELGYTLFLVDIPGKFDRPGVYADPNGGYYGDELERSLCFQIGVLNWLRQFHDLPSVLHCHDHHTGLIPFLIKHSPEYWNLAHIPTVFTIHNGEYHGAFSWNNRHLLPAFPPEAGGLIEWKNTINPLASGIKNSWMVTTVSPSYLNELGSNSNGLEWLLNNERHKSVGILNGIDTQVWDPKTDAYLHARLENDDVAKFKAENRAILNQRFRIHPDLPLITFIGRLVREKGADLIPDVIKTFLYYGHKAAFVVLGTGDSWVENSFRHMQHHLTGNFDAALEYNEGLAHQLYAGSDFLLMPSRVEPCGLNQMYAMRYGTVPIVRSVGGLRDTVPDIGEAGDSGRGIRFDQFSVDDAFVACYRASEVYKNQIYLKRLRQRIMNVDLSWEQSAQQYIQVYQQVLGVHVGI